MVIEKVNYYLQMIIVCQENLKISIKKHLIEKAFEFKKDTQAVLLLIIVQ